MKPKLFMVVNEDRFFLSHRKPVALEAARQGWDVRVVAKDTGHRKDIESLGLKFIDLPINPTGMNLREEYRTLVFLWNLYRREKPDVVHHVGMKNILWGGAAAKMLRIKGVVNAVSGLGGLFATGHKSKVATGILLIMRWANRRKNVRLIFQNKDDRAEFESHHVSKPGQAAFTHGSGIDLNEYAFAEEPSKGLLQIIFTGRMVREKGVGDIIRASKILEKDYRGKIRFILCGRLTPNKTGIDEEYLEKNCDGEYVAWLGERNDIKQLLEKSHIMLFPSYYREGVPKSLIEASAVGLPIITCDSTGCRDVVTDGENGFLVPPRNSEMVADRLKRLIDNPGLRQRMRVAARAKAERDFGIDEVVRTHMQIYNQLSGYRP